MLQFQMNRLDVTVITLLGDCISSSPSTPSGGWLAEDRQTRTRLALFCSAQHQLILLQSPRLQEHGTKRGGQTARQAAE